MLERSNQTAEVALRYYIATLEDARAWPTVLPRMSVALNNSTNYSSTAQAPTQVLYGFRIREALDLLRIQDPDDDNRGNVDNPDNVDNAGTLPEASAASDNVDNPANQNPRSVRQPPAGAQDAGNIVNAYPANPSPVHLDDKLSKTRPVAMNEYRPAHIDAKDAIAFAAIKMKQYYDATHTPKYFKEGDMVHLRLHKGYHVPGIKSKKIGPQLVGPFRIAKRVGTLAYQLDLPPNMRIHSVISIAHLEPATNPEDNPYRRRRLPTPVVVEGEEE